MENLIVENEIKIEDGSNSKNLSKRTAAKGKKEGDQPEVGANISEVLPEATVTELKPGQAIRQRFQVLVNAGKITEEYISALVTKESTAQFFGVRYPFLLTYDGTKTIKEQATINGHVRYGSKPITINGKEYIICNDLYSRTVSKFNEWANSVEQKESQRNIGNV